jgi:hypothetical protein
LWEGKGCNHHLQTLNHHIRIKPPTSKHKTNSVKIKTAKQNSMCKDKVKRISKATYLIEEEED